MRVTNPQVRFLCFGTYRVEDRARRGVAQRRCVLLSVLCAQLFLACAGASANADDTNDGKGDNKAGELPHILLAVSRSLSPSRYLGALFLDLSFARACSLCIRIHTSH